MDSFSSGAVDSGQMVRMENDGLPICGTPLAFKVLVSLVSVAAAEKISAVQS